ncbi:hypothetical protein D3C80_1023180 [compost metagenome]
MQIMDRELFHQAREGSISALHQCCMLPGEQQLTLQLVLMHKPLQGSQGQHRHH